MRLDDILFSLLKYEICGTKLSDEARAEITPEMLPKLFAVSKFHDLSHIVADALQKEKLLIKDGEVSKKFQKKQIMSVYRYEQMKLELGNIRETLEKNKIPFIPLKGSVIRDYYPEPWMRTSCDIDVLVKRSDLDKAIEALSKEQNYVTDGKINSHDVSMFSPGKVHLELHFSIERKVEKLDKFLSDPWKYATLKEGSDYEYLFDSDFYVYYMVVHMASHFRIGGCGIKPFLDFWIWKNKVGFNRERVVEFCRESDLLTFYEAVESLTDRWFDGKECSDFVDKFRVYILNGGVYGTKRNNMSIDRVKQGGNGKYIMNRIFMPYKELVTVYPKLKNRKILMPYYQICRWCNIVFKRKMKSAAKEMKINSTVSEKTVEDTAELFEKFGL